MAREKSRTQRWNDAAARAEEALVELKGVQEEYRDWQDNLPENFQETAAAEKLELLCAQCCMMMDISGNQNSGAMKTTDNYQALEEAMDKERDHVIRHQGSKHILY